MYISINIASHKARELQLKVCLLSLLNQNTKPTVINVYLNDYMEQPWQKALSKKSPINFIDGGDDLGASAKFWFADSQEEGVYLTFDDDLVAQPGYVGYMVDSAFRFPNALVGLHGTVYTHWPVDSYYHGPGRQIMYCYGENTKNRIVHMLGSGCLAFRVGMINAPTIADFPVKNMTDPYVYKWASTNKQSLVCLHRASGFVKEQADSQDSAIWKHVAKDCSVQTEVINAFPLPNTMFYYECSTKEYQGAALEWNHIKEIAAIINHETKVVEFGSGVSTEYLRELTEHLTSFEHNGKWATAEWIQHRPIDPKTEWYSLNRTDKRIIREAEVVIIDGPIGSSGERYNLPMNLLNEDAIFIVDDVNRPKDMEQAKAISKMFGREMKVIKGIEKNIAII